MSRSTYKLKFSSVERMLPLSNSQPFKNRNLSTALGLAAIHGRLDFIAKTYNFDSNDNKFSRFLSTLFLLSGNRKNRQSVTIKTVTFLECFDFLDARGLISLIVVPRKAKHFPHPAYAYYLAKNLLWDKLYNDVSKSDLSSREIRNNICNGVLFSCNDDVLKSPPKELDDLEDWSKKKYYETIKSSRNAAFPFNLVMEDQVEYFADDIRNLGYDKVNSLVLSRVRNYESLIALEKVFDKRFSPYTSNLDELSCRFWRSNLSIEEELQIAEHFGISTKDYLKTRLTLITKSVFPNLPIDRFQEFVKEYLGRGYSIDKIQKYLDIYQTIFPNETISST